MVLFSTDESIENNKFSLMALFETIFAVLLYWGIAVYFDTYIHIVTSIVVAPFLLLKSKKSVQLGLNMLRVGIIKNKLKYSYLDKKFRKYVEISLVLVSIALILFAYYFSNHFIHMEDTILYASIKVIMTFVILLFILKGIVFTLIFGGLNKTMLEKLLADDNENNKVFKVFIQIFTVIIFIFGIIFTIELSIVIFIKMGIFISIITFLLLTYFTIVLSQMIYTTIKDEFTTRGLQIRLLFFRKNNGFLTKEGKVLKVLKYKAFFQFLKDLYDLSWLPEFLGIITFITSYKVVSTLRYIAYGYKQIPHNLFVACLVYDFKKSSEIMPELEKTNSSILLKFSTRKILAEYRGRSLLQNIYGWLEFIAFYIVAIFYRISLKSTFWFYIPLIFIVKSPTSLNSSQEIGKFLSEFHGTGWSKLRLFAGILTLMDFFISYFNLFGFIAIRKSPFSSSLIFQFFDFSSLELWRLLALASAILTIVLFFYSDHIRTPKNDNGIEITEDISVKTIYYLNMLKNFFTVSYLTLATLYLMFFYRIWEYAYIPNFMKNFLEIIDVFVRYKLFF